MITSLVLLLFATTMSPFASSPALADPPSSADGDVPVTRIATKSSTPGGGGVFLDKTYYLPTVPENLLLTGRPGSSAPYVVDDEIEIRVAHLDKGTSDLWRWDYSKNCTADEIAPLPASDNFNIKRLLASGRNVIQVRLIDKCGSSRGSSDLYVEGAHMTQTAGDRTDIIGDLYTPGRSDTDGGVNDCGAISPAMRGVEFAGPLVIDGTVSANARINTYNFFCGATGGRQALSVADCAECGYSELTSGLYGFLPANGSLRTPVLSAKPLPGVHYYRLELDIKVPQVGASNSNYPVPSITGNYAYSASVKLVG